MKSPSNLLIVVAVAAATPLWADITYYDPVDRSNVTCTSMTNSLHQNNGVRVQSPVEEGVEQGAQWRINE